MEEDDDRKCTHFPGFISGGNDETEPEMAGRIDGDVGGLNAVNWIGIGRSFEGEEIEEAAVDSAVLTARIIGNGRDDG